MIKEEEKKNQVTFPKASVSGTAKVCPSLLVLTGAKRINQPSGVLACQASSLQPVPLLWGPSERHQSWGREQGMGSTWRGVF